MATESSRTSLIRFEKSEQTAIITLNNPERRNAINHVMDRELARRFSECEMDDSIRAIIVTGMGNIFSSGADLESGLQR